MIFYKRFSVFFLIFSISFLLKCEDTTLIGEKFEVIKENDTLKNVTFMDKDKHEEYLQAFDENNIKVFLQVESGHAEMDSLIDIVFNHYGHHECVVGFGVDVEWYKSNNGLDINGIEHIDRVTDVVAEQWLKKVKSHNENYKMFLKHWDIRMMPPTYRGDGDIVFLDDSQDLTSLKLMKDEFEYWSDYFYPNPVHFQIGYSADKKWWSSMINPMQEIGTSLSDIVNDGQELGVFWVDFEFDEIADNNHTLAINPPKDRVQYAGFRSSSYGFDTFPSKEKWVETFKKAASYFENATPCAVWIIGEIGEKGECKLFFPRS